MEIKALAVSPGKVDFREKAKQMVRAGHVARGRKTPQQLFIVRLVLL